MRIGGISPISTIDWDGKVSLVVYTVGCNFRCPFCYNTDFFDMTHGKEMTVKDLEITVDKQQGFIDAIIFCGGEPTLQDDLVEFCKYFKAKGLSVKVDTNGSRPDVIQALLSSGSVDRISLDFKTEPNESSYLIATGSIATDLVVTTISTMMLVKDYSKELEIRTTIVPGINDDDKYVSAIAEVIAPYADIYYLQQFTNRGVTNPLFKDVKSPPISRLIELGKIAKNKEVKCVMIRPGYLEV
jgi:pyruvate formate lyase activating enzyme